MNRRPADGACEPRPGAGLVHVIDDDDGMSESLCELLQLEGMDAMAYARPDDFLAAGRGEAPSCVLLDLCLEGTSGLDFQERLLGLSEAPPVILMSAYGDVPAVVRGMKAGAVDFLTKPFSVPALLAVTRAAIELDRRRREEARAAGRARARYESLNRRERDVMRWVVEGLMSKQIAAQLHLSEITVKVYRSSMMRKMGTRSLPELVRLAVLLEI